MANTFKFGNGKWAVKDGYALAYNDENGNFKPLPFDFTRATSATRVNKDGLIEVVTNNKPRIDFLNDSNGALLLENSRSNIALYSEDFSNGVYTKSNGSVATNTAISPDGTQNADTWTATSGSANLQGLVSITSGVQYTMSIYLKRKTGTGQVSLRGVSNTSTPITITDEWQRYSVTLTSTDTNGRYGVLLLNSGDEVYVWGAQLEAGSYPTSYIPTQGSAVTRVAETCSDAGNNQVINSTEGVIYCEIASLVETPETRSVIGISVAGDTDNRVTIEYNAGDTNLIRGQVRTTSLQATIGYVVTSIKDFHKVALVYQLDNVQLWIDGVKVGEDLNADASSPNTISMAAFLINNTNNFQGKCKGFRIYDTVLTDAELQALTT
jgi:tRNA threonylcarbamoyladenosine modification (KEOPS) complex  Pcc1 subunit